MTLCESMASLRCPRWEELPDLYLYMDQVISVLEKQLAPFQLTEGESPITSTMINNYVKQRLIPPPEKKRYGRGQLALLYICALLKPVLTLGELDAVLKAELEKGEIEVVYDRFCDALEGSLHAVFGCGEKIPMEEESLLFAAGTAAFAYQLYARDILSTLTVKEEEKASEESKKKKKKTKEDEETRLEGEET